VSPWEFRDCGVSDVKHFVSTQEVPAIAREREHGGSGPIEFRRMLECDDFATNIDFVDYTVIPAGSTIGRHIHTGNEELYFISAGNPLVCVDGTARRANAGSIVVVHSGEWHELVNDTDQAVAIFVIQVHK
jgi:mannose-6-phosphate isomerase-like protein (cupin superfamily)